MFWGLVLEPSKRYTQIVQQSFHISQAALEISTADQEPIQLILEFDGANYVLATLSKKNNLYQIPLDLNFNTGDQISFRTIGKGRVHLTGYHILEDDLEDMVLNGEEESDVEEEEEEESTPSKLDSSKQVKRKKPDSSKNVNNKKTKLSAKNEVEASEESDDEETLDDFDVDMSDSDDDEDEEDDECEEEEDDEDDYDDDDMELGEGDDDDDDEDDLEEEETEGKKKTPASASKQNKANVSINGKSPKNKKLNDSKVLPKPDKKNITTPGKEPKEVKTPKSEKKSPKNEKKGKENKGESSPQKKVLEGGVVVEELRMGEGQAAKAGKMVQVYYVGRLQSNKKQFDATTQGPGFRFRLGKGEVIRGWDIGVTGMKVGGKRRITIPAQLAYGAKGAPPAIPPNSTLVFEVELKGVN